MRELSHTNCGGQISHLLYLCYRRVYDALRMTESTRSRGLGVGTFFPPDGLEFALGAVVVLTLSIYWLADGMRGGEINGCPVDI